MSTPYVFSYSKYAKTNKEFLIVIATLLTQIINKIQAWTEDFQNQPADGFMHECGVEIIVNGVFWHLFLEGSTGSPTELYFVECDEHEGFATCLERSTTDCPSCLPGHSVFITRPGNSSHFCLHVGCLPFCEFSHFNVMQCNGKLKLRDAQQG